MEYTSSDKQNLLKLYLGRVQLIATNELVDWHLIRRNFPMEVEQFQVIAKHLKQEELRIMISRKYPASTEPTKRFNTALASLSRNGVISKVIAKYGIAE